jgi:hypothetical protein
VGKAASLALSAQEVHHLHAAPSVVQQLPPATAAATTPQAEDTRFYLECHPLHIPATSEDRISYIEHS